MNPMALIVGFVLLGFLTVSVIKSSRKARRSARLSSLPWKKLVEELQPVCTKEITALAQDHLQPSGSLYKSDPKELWDLLGGAGGLDRMRDNIEILIALASYAEQWDPDNSRIVAEKIRRDGLALRRAIQGLGIGAITGILSTHVSLYFHEAASSYYLMTRRLIVLYKETHEGLAPVLETILYE